MGYRFGTFDQVFHITFMKAFVNPALYQNDPLVGLRWQNYSLFWVPFQLFYKLDLLFGFQESYILETVIFAGHVLVTYLTFWAVWGLTDELFHNPLTSLIATTAFVMPHIGLSCITPIEFSLLNRTASLPILLYCLRLQLQKHTWLSLSLIGLLFNIHIISALFGLSMLLCELTLNWKRVDWKQSGVGLSSMIILALPVAIWKTSGPPIDPGVNQHWFDTVNLSVLQHINSLWGLPFVNVLTLGGLGSLGMFLIARRYAASESHPASQDAFFLAPILIVLFQVALMYLYPATIFMQLQLMRAGLLALIMGYVSFANYLAVRYETNNHEWNLLCLTTILNIFPFLVLLTWAPQNWLPARRGRLVLAWMIMLGGTAAVIAYLFQYSVILAFGVNIYPARTDWYEAQRWARDHTPTDAMFIAPPYIWSFAEPDWRAFSERGTVASLTDGLEFALIPEYLPVWEKRFESVAPGALAQFTGNYFENKAFTIRAYYSLTPQQVETVADDYQAYYLVVEKPNTRPFYLCYENPQFIVYAITQAAAMQAGCRLK